MKANLGGGESGWLTTHMLLAAEIFATYSPSRYYTPDANVEYLVTRAF